MSEHRRSFAEWQVQEEKRKRSVESWKRTVFGFANETDELCMAAQHCLDSCLDRNDAEGWRDFVTDSDEALSIGFFVSESERKITGYGVDAGPCTIVVPFPSDQGIFVWPDDDDLPAFSALLAQSLHPFSEAFSSWRTSAICLEKKKKERENER